MAKPARLSPEAQLEKAKIAPHAGSQSHQPFQSRPTKLNAQGRYQARPKPAHYRSPVVASSIDWSPKAPAPSSDGPTPAPTPTPMDPNPEPRWTRTRMAKNPLSSQYTLTAHQRTRRHARSPHAQLPQSETKPQRWPHRHNVPTDRGPHSEALDAHTTTLRHNDTTPSRHYHQKPAGSPSCLQPDAQPSKMTPISAPSNQQRTSPTRPGRPAPLAPIQQRRGAPQ